MEIFSFGWLGDVPQIHGFVLFQQLPSGKMGTVLFFCVTSLQAGTIYGDVVHYRHLLLTERQGASNQFFTIIVLGIYDEGRGPCK